LRWELNWQPLHGPSWDLAPGLTIRHTPGHTPGLCILQVNLKNSGTWIFTTDQYHVKENYWDSTPQGWLARDHDGWVRSHQMVKSLVKQTKGNLVFGHCLETLGLYKTVPHFYD
jgi:glyoxylase-like metal-dependent hydrolase (beta-lactamase superfamily II)